MLKTHSFIVVCFDSIVFGEEGLKLLSELVTNPHLEKSPIVLLANEKIQAEIDKSGMRGVHCVIKAKSSPAEIAQKIAFLVLGTSR